MARPHDVSTKRIGRPIYTYAATYVNECTYITFTCRHTRTKTCTAANAYTRRIYVVPPILPDIPTHTHGGWRWILCPFSAARAPGTSHGRQGARQGRLIRVAVSLCIYTYTCPGNARAYVRVRLGRGTTYTSCLLAAPLHELRRTGTARTNTTHNTHHTRQAACVQG